MKNNLMDDPIGEAIKEYFEKKKAPDVEVNTNYTEGESIPTAYFFRTEDEFPLLEKEAMKLCKGKILDIGAAAGCHSLVLQKKGYNVTAIDTSTLSIEVMKKRGIVKAINSNIFDFKEQQFNTLLLLMNGAGMGGSIAGLEKLLQHLKQLLMENGQILMDSSDIKYLFEEEDGSMWIDLANDKYYGEMEYEVSFRKSKVCFNWLYVGFDKLKETATKLGYNCSLIKEGNSNDYLAQLKLK
jgi:SAM-dependent methyltransferase